MNTAVHSYQRNSQSQEREQLILDNIDFVRQILSKMTFQVENDDDRQNLNSSGIVGLVEAANQFDPGQGVAFRTYAYPRIRGAILDELRRVSPVSQNTLKQIGVIKKTYQTLSSPVSPEELAEAACLTLDEIIKCLEAMRFAKPDDWCDLESIVHSSWQSNQETPEQNASRRETKKILADAITQLPKRERLVLTLYYSEELTLLEIGKVLDVSESRVSKILASARFRLGELIKPKLSDQKDW